MFGSLKAANLAIARLEDNLKGLRVAVDELSSANKRLQLEWTETYDKVRHQLSRMARRGDLGNGKEEVGAPSPEGMEESEVDAISAKILARRSRMFLGRD